MIGRKSPPSQSKPNHFRFLQCVRVGSSLSHSYLVSSGVPQGSVVGPILFNLYVNDITDGLDLDTTTTKIFADDVKIYTELSSQNSSFNLQNNLDLIHQWSALWQLTISYSKCNILFLGKSDSTLNFSISGNLLHTTIYCTDLGIQFDPDLKYKNHISDMVKRAKKRSSLIHRCFISRNIKHLIRAFKTYVRPLVEYAPQILSPYQILLIDAIEGIKRSFTKRLPGFANKSCAKRLHSLHLQRLEHRRLLFDLIICFNIVRGFTALSFKTFSPFLKILPPKTTLSNLLSPSPKKHKKIFLFFPNSPYMELSPSTICLCIINCQIQISYHQPRPQLFSHSPYIHSLNSPTPS